MLGNFPPRPTLTSQSAPRTFRVLPTKPLVNLNRARQGLLRPTLRASPRPDSALLPTTARRFRIPPSRTHPGLPRHYATAVRQGAARRLDRRHRSRRRGPGEGTLRPIGHPVLRCLRVVRRRGADHAPYSTTRSRPWRSRREILGSGEAPLPTPYMCLILSQGSGV